jgi:metal-sulfur cluster biosynthetic enzyme
MEARVPTQEQVLEVLAQVDDPEIDKPITELGMVDEVAIEGTTVGREGQAHRPRAVR